VFIGMVHVLKSADTFTDEGCLNNVCGECIHNRRVVLSLWFIGGIACSDKKEECQFYQEYFWWINT
jgi:hypothetical protein